MCLYGFAQEIAATLVRSGHENTNTVILVYFNRRYRYSNKKVIGAKRVEPLCGSKRLATKSIDDRRSSTDFGDVLGVMEIPEGNRSHDLNSGTSEARGGVYRRMIIFL